MHCGFRGFRGGGFMSFDRVMPVERPPARTPLVKAQSIKSVVLLSGSIRNSDLGKLSGRALLNMPLLPDRSVFAVWAEGTSALAEVLGAESLALRVIVDRVSTPPVAPASPRGVRITIENEHAEFRGTAGILKEVCAGYGDDDRVVMGNGNQVVLGSLAGHVNALLEAGGDIAMFAHADGLPVGLMLLRAGVMREVKERAFMDLKEQVMPELAAKFDVRVVRREEATGVPIRTLDGYMLALRAWHHVQSGRPPFDTGLDAEQWFATFGVVEPGAAVGAGVRVHDSVVLQGARVGEGAVLVRSVVSGSGVVPSRAVVVDRVVTGRFEGA